MTNVSVVYRFIVRLTVFLFNVLMLLAIIYGDFLLLKKKQQIKWRNSKEKVNFIIRYLWNIQIFQNKNCIIWFRNNRFFKIIFIYLDFWTKFNSSPLLRGGGVLLFLFCSLPFQSLTLYDIYYVNSSSQNILRTMLHC